MFKREKQRLKEFLRSVLGRIAFTLDCLTSLNTNGFVSLIADYMDDN